jgi:phosphatidylglycerophosphate synthase
MGAIVSPQLRARVRGLAEPIALAFGRLGLSPNALTLIGFFIALAAAGRAAVQDWVFAGVLVVVGGVFDLFDGALARATNRVTRVGAFLDSVFDRAGEGLAYLGIATGFIVAGMQEAAVLAGGALVASFLVSYTRAKSESLGFTPGTGMANVGLAPREVRLAILTIGLLAAGLNATWLVVALALITILATITTLQRILHVIRQPTTEEHE